MPRYVILEHDHPHRHWDFLLEAGDVLRAWRLLQEPGLDRTVPAEANFDHRKVYLDYEGPLTGERGSIFQWDSGSFEWIVNEPANVVVILDGHKLKGRARLKDDSFRFQRNATGD